MLSRSIYKRKLRESLSERESSRYWHKEQETITNFMKQFCALLMKNQSKSKLIKFRPCLKTKCSFRLFCSISARN